MGKNPRQSNPYSTNLQTAPLVSLKGHYASLSTAERRVADVIMSSPSEVVQASITELARRSEVGVGTVGRLCMKLGYSGFPALKLALAADVNETSHGAVGFLEYGDSFEAIISKTTQVAVQNLQDTEPLLDPEHLEHAASAIKRASFITVYALSSTDHAIALLLYVRLLQLGIPCRLFTYNDDHLLHRQAPIRNEMVVVISHSDDGGHLEKSMGIIASQGIHILLLTTLFQHPLTEVSHMTLTAATRSTGTVVEDSGMVVGLHLLVEVLYSALAVGATSKGEKRNEGKLPIIGRRRLNQLRVATTRLPTTMDPHQHPTIANGRIYPMVFSTLINRDWTGSDMRLVPGLASNWYRLDEHTLDITLRNDVYWHDGTQLTVEDVIYTFERIQSGDAQLKVAHSRYWSIENIERVDEFRLRMVTSDPDPFLEMRLASHHVAYILPAHHIESEGADAFAKGNVVGTGPYKLMSWQDQDFMVFEANESFFEGSPAAETVVLYQEPDVDKRTSGLLHGQFDLLTDVPPNQIEAINQNEGYYLTSELVGLNYELLYNMQAPPLDRREIRQALSIAIDRQQIIDDIFLGFAVHPRGSQIPGEHYYEPYRNKLQFDPEAAKQLLVQGGYNGETIRFAAYSPDYYILNRAMVEAIAAMWQAIGVRVEIEYFLPLGSRSALVEQGNTTHHVFETSIGSYNDMHQRLIGKWGKSSEFQRVGFWSAESAQRYNKLVDDLLATRDSVVRQRVYKNLLDELEYEVPGTPILIPELIYAMRDNIYLRPNNYQGLDLRPANFQLLDKGDG